MKADTVTLSGTGAVNGSITLWILGQNYFATKTIEPDKKGNYTFIIKPEETKRFSAGEYAFLIQDPGADRSFEIGPLLWNDGACALQIREKSLPTSAQISSFPVDIGPIAATILNASVRPDVDDIFTPYYFYVEEPAMHFNRVNDAGKLPDQTTGEVSSDHRDHKRRARKSSSMFQIRNATSGDLITSETIPVVEGSNTNQWTYSLEEPGLPAGIYNVTVGEQKYTTPGNASAQLTVLEYLIAGNSSLSLSLNSGRDDSLWCHPPPAHQLCRSCNHRDHHAGIIAEMSVSISPYWIISCYNPYASRAGTSKPPVTE